MGLFPGKTRRVTVISRGTIPSSFHRIANYYALFLHRLQWSASAALLADFHERSGRLMGYGNCDDPSMWEYLCCSAGRGGVQ